MTHQVVWLCGNLCERCSSSLQPGIACLPQTRAFFDCVYLRICKTRKATCAYGHLLWIWMSVRCRFGCRSDHAGFPRSMLCTAKMQRFRESSWTSFLSNQKENGFGNISPQLNASSKHLCLSLLQMVSVVKFHAYDLDVVSGVVSDVVPDVVPHLNGLPSNS